MTSVAERFECPDCRRMVTRGPDDAEGIAAALAFERERDLPRGILIDKLEAAQGGAGA